MATRVHIPGQAPVPSFTDIINKDTVEQDVMKNLEGKAAMTATCIFCGELIPEDRVVRGTKAPQPTKFCSLKCNAKADTARLKFRRDMSWKLAAALREVLNEAEPGALGINSSEAFNLLEEYDRGPVFPAQKGGE